MRDRQTGQEPAAI